MKFCAACCNELPQEKFSKKQWKLKQHQRRCTDCIDADREVQLKSPSPSKENSDGRTGNEGGGDEAPSCYICLEDGLDDSGGKLRRDCSCRGGSGFVHMSCIGHYAEQKFKSNTKIGSHPWKYCPNCHHEYQNTFAIDLAKLYVACMGRNYKRMHLHINIIEAQITLLENLVTVVTPDVSRMKYHSESQTEEAKQIANDILHKVRRMKLKGIISSNARIYEAYSYEALGNFAQIEAAKNGGDKQLFSEAMKYFEKSLDVATANNFPEGISRAKALISMVRSNMGEAEHVTASLDQMEMIHEIEAKKSESSVDAIQSGVRYAEALKKSSKQGVKSTRLFMKLREICQRVHGSDHKLTQLVKKKKKDCSTTWMSSEGNGDRHIFMDYDGSFEKCVGLNKDLNIFQALSTETSIESLIPIQSLYIDDIVFDDGTPVFSSPHPISSNVDPNQFKLGDIRIWDLGAGGSRNLTITPTELNAQDLKLGDIRSWDKNTKCYTIQWEDESIEPCAVPRDRVFVPSCFCDGCMEFNKQFTANQCVKAK